MKAFPYSLRWVMLWMVIFTTVLAWSAYAPKDRFTWWLEVLPAIGGFVILWLTHRRFTFTPLVYWLILIHCIILMIGGHYTYAEVPVFDWLKDSMGWQRNNYDKVGHFAQGLIPFMIARELIVRWHLIARPGWRNFFLLCWVLALSAFYELIEWWVALASGEGANAFLGTQGDVWDTQSDMFMALLGGFGALLFLSNWHDRQLERWPHQQNAQNGDN